MAAWPQLETTVDILQKKYTIVGWVDRCPKRDQWSAKQLKILYWTIVIASGQYQTQAGLHELTTHLITETD